MFAAAFTPIPYKVITILAGVFAINFPMFLLGSALGRSARFFLVAWLFKKFGPGIKDFIEKRFALVTFLGTVLLVGGFVAIKFVFHTDEPPKVENGEEQNGPEQNGDGK